MMFGCSSSLLCLLLLSSAVGSSAQITNVRLVGGLSRYEGRVEIYTFEHGWGTVCDEDWGINEARVVCRQLGYPAASEAHRDAHFGPGSGSLFIDDFECRGSESDLSDCLIGDSWPEWSCDHGDDVSVTCGEATALDVRLVNGDTSREGRVEVNVPGQGWGTICDEDWGLNEARVVCRQLGFPVATKAPRNAYFGEGSGTIYVDDLDCDGYESNLGQCITGDTWSYAGCNHDDDVGVVCGAAGISTAVGIILGGLAAFIILR